MKNSLFILFFWFFAEIFQVGNNWSNAYGSPGQLVNPDISIETVTEMKKKIPTIIVTVWEPHENQNVQYRAFKLSDVLYSYYQQSWGSSDIIVFTCADGYRSSIPTERIKSFPAYLAFERVGSSDFVVDNLLQNEEHVKLGPLYLIWDNLNYKELLEDGAVHWPYQIVNISPSTLSTMFPQIVPKRGSTSGAVRGLALFSKYCLSCHRINGAGGEKGPELTNILGFPNQNKEAMKYVYEYIINPRQVNPQSKMPSLADSLTDREKAVTEIIDYLDAINRE